MKRIILTQGKEAKVDDADFEWLSEYKWFVYLSTSGSYYACRNNRSANGGNVYIEKMHRRIMGLGKGDTGMVDHINGDSLDNRRSNLRIVTNQQNSLNRGKQSNNHSGYKGVHRHSTSGKWIAQITAKGNTYHLGSFLTPEEASQAYKTKAAELHGVYGRYN